VFTGNRPRNASGGACRSWLDFPRAPAIPEAPEAFLEKYGVELACKRLRQA
jgi:hypothetical protein